MGRKVGKAFIGLLAVLIVVFFLVRNPDKSLSELSQLYENGESEWIDVDGLQVHYRVEGSGPPLVLIHGTGASLHTWDGWTKALKDRFTIYRMDIPAFGLTGPAPDGDYTIQAYVDFIHSFMNEMKRPSFAIAGNSLGGYIAWAYALAHPDSVEKLILIDAAGYPHEGASDALAFKIASNPYLRPLMKQVTPKSFIRKNLEQVYGDDSKITEALVARYHDMSLRDGNRQAFIDRVHTVHKNISDQIPNISCPTLIMWGAEDTWTPVGDARRFNRDISYSRLIMYEGVGHVPMEEIPEQSAMDALNFLLE